MRVVRHGRTPRVQHRGDADARAEMFGIGRDRQHGFGRNAEQQVVEQRLVVEGDLGDLRW
jgi:hypothetical protein